MPIQHPALVADQTLLLTPSTALVESASHIMKHGARSHRGRPSHPAAKGL